MAYRSDFDSAWKDALDVYFPQFMALLWPSLHAQIDWRHEPAFLDKELQALMRSRKRGRRHVDKLVSVRLQGGRDALVLIHVEIQAGHDSGFAQRMFAYHVRLCERYPQHPVAGLAVLTGQAAITGSDAPPRATQDRLAYAYGYWGCELHFTFPVVRLETWRARVEELFALAPQNPFAVVILAQLEADTTRDAQQRLVRKAELARRLYHWGFSRDNVVRLFRIIDAMVGLPEALEPAFDDAVSQIEEEKQMAYVTSIERVRLKRERAQGMQQGAAEMLSAQLTRKFGSLPDWASARMSQADETTLNRWAVQLLDAQRIEDVFV